MGCNRRVAKLFLGGEAGFKCRRCWRLVYEFGLVPLRLRGLGAARRSADHWAQTRTCSTICGQGQKYMHHSTFEKLCRRYVIAAARCGAGQFSAVAAVVDRSIGGSRYKIELAGSVRRKDPQRTPARTAGRWMPCRSCRVACSEKLAIDRRSSKSALPLIRHQLETLSLNPERRVSHGLQSATLRTRHRYKVSARRFSLGCTQFGSAGISCCQRLTAPAIAAPRMGASQNSQSCAI